MPFLVLVSGILDREQPLMLFPPQVSVFGMIHLSMGPRANDGSISVIFERSPIRKIVGVQVFNELLAASFFKARRV